MGTAFVSLKRLESAEDEPGFWMEDRMLGLWLRLLALHLPEPTTDAERAAVTPIRDQWLLASHVGSGGYVPHGLESVAATEVGRQLIRTATESLLQAIECEQGSLDAGTLNLLGLPETFTGNIDRQRLRDIGWAFLDLLDDRVRCTARSTEVMPGSYPYRRAE